MRRFTLALLVTLCGAVPALARQVPPTPPPPPATVAPPAMPAPPAPPAPTAGMQATRPQTAVAPRVPQAPTPPPAPQAPRAEPASSWQNIRVEVTISDSLSSDAQNKKLVSMLIVDGRSGSVRSASDRGVINIDARPSIRPDGRIYLQITVEYRPELNADQMNKLGSSRVASFNEGLSLVVTDGKPVLASQSADPVGDRRVTLEITATVLK